ncbi:hypothetical protein E4T49_03623 [Aureobasidium sp. EXF-10728]|nr:hypothetical protein E4T49_03623 [Aureobasidium sp. EXF-10728]
MNEQYGAYPPSGQSHPSLQHHASNRSQESPRDNAPSLSTPLSPMFGSLGSGQSTHGSFNMASRPYNPQQWGQNNVVGGSHMAFSPTQRFARDTTGMEVGTFLHARLNDQFAASMPSPPPPYTPPPDSTSRLMRSAPVVGFVSSPLSVEPSSAGTTSHHSTPPSGPSAHFPPPPTSNSRDRSSSGVSRDPQRSRFSISGLAARVKRSDSSDQISTLNSLHTQLPVVSAGSSSRPPASRRAASTGAILTHAPQQISTGRSSPEASRWKPGMPLPPPPPGPPPENRSQSLNRYARRTTETRADTTTSSVLPPPPPPPVRRRHENTLGEIPPTPSDWNPDMDIDPGFMELRLDTGRQADASSAGRSGRNQLSASREAMTDSIRERRSRSRAKREGQEIVLEDKQVQEVPNHSTPSFARPSNLTLATGDGLLRRRRNAAVESSSSQSSPAQPSSPESARRQGQGRNNLTILTPPYTPSIAVPQKGLLHHVATPNEQSSNQPPHTSHTQPPTEKFHSGTANYTSPPNPSGLSEFAQSSLQRYQIFVDQEVAAESDRERLELFASFMVQESRLRRGLYSEAFNTMAGDIMELTRDMWRPLPATSEPVTSQPKSRNVSPESANIMIDLDGSFHTSIASTAELTPATDTESPADESQDAADRRSANPWGDKFKPCLSPIPSMAVSTVPDEESSRGRSASRWWEESVDGSFGNGGRRLERTRQEAKYMSLHPQELFLAAQPSPNQSTPTPGTSKQTFQYGPDEYPQEKVGWHEEDGLYTPSNPPSATLLSPRNKAPVGRPTGRSALDVTRLVTLPPPYPRHYPAVNNSHPALSTLRANHRAVADLSGIRELVQSHEATETSRRQQWRTLAGERLRHFRSQTQASINSGKISYNDATQAELTFRQSEAANVLRQAETQCQDFRQRVHEPVCRMLAEHSRSCDDCIDQLTRALDAEAGCDQNLLAQTEGDERPELVEQLTLLKWLFESREHIHKERFDIDTALLARESASVLTNYRQNANEVQLRQAEHHFECERQRRQLRYAQETNDRYDNLRKTAERHISRGVEIQLSAFWDIAPGLVEVVHKVPDNLHGFEIVVPPNELAENVSYHEFPLHYMYSILVHAKKSAYQFIEAQTNLLCLLHEVHTATEAAALRLREIERSAAGEGASQVQAEMIHAKQQKEQELTEDLQGKVHEVEGQWTEALGASIEDCIERVRTWLEHTGGWDESLEV